MIANAKFLSVYAKLSMKRTLHLVECKVNVYNNFDLTTPLALSFQLAIRDLPTYHEPTTKPKVK